MAKEERGREGRSEGGRRKPGKTDYKSKRSFSRNKSIRENSDKSPRRGRAGERPARSDKFKSGDRDRFNRSGFKRDDRPSRSDDGRKREWDRPKREGSERSGDRKWSEDRDRARKPGYRDRDDRSEKSYPAKREGRNKRPESGDEKEFDRERPRRENRGDREESKDRRRPFRENRDAESDDRPGRRSSDSDGPRRERREGSEFKRDDRREGYRKRGSDDERPRRRSDDKPEKDSPQRERKEDSGFKRDDRREGYRKRGSDDERPRRRGDDIPERSRRNDGERSYSRDRSERSHREERRRDSRDEERSAELPKKEKGTAPARKQQKGEGEIRLNKYLASAGIASRREADTLISSGAVSVNGQVVTQLGFMVKPGDTVNYGGQSIKGERKVYLLLNKPKDYITTVDDPRDRKTVMHLIEGACRERVYPVGRLDRNTTGVLLLTNDGELTKKLTHPKYGIKKVYHVTLNKGLKIDDFKKITEGVELEDGIIKADDLSFVGEGKKEVGIEIHSGRNRVVRRLFEHLGYDVIKLDRVVFAGLTKKDLSRGRHRFLTAKEIAFLKMLG